METPHLVDLPVSESRFMIEGLGSAQVCTSLPIHIFNKTRVNRRHETDAGLV